MHAYWVQKQPCRRQHMFALQASGHAEQAAAPTFFDIISGDEDTTLRSIVQITNGVTGIVDKVQTLLVYWEKKYKHMWDQDKDAYIRCECLHGLCCPPLSAAALLHEQQQGCNSACIGHCC